MSALIVPEWYIQAKKDGKSEQEIYQKTAEFCLEALRSRAAKKGEAAPDAASEALVRLTLGMYETAFTASAAKT